MLAFHGFGQNGADFKAFEHSLGDTFTFYSFDLFHHGRSEYVGKPITENELRILFEIFFEKESIDRFSVMCFSLGGRVAFKAIELYEDRIDYALMLAPDGMRINPFYIFVAHTKFGAAIYKTVIHHPGIYFGPLKLLRKAGLVKAKLYQFVINQMRTRHKREMVLRVWITFREIVPKLQNIQRIVNKGNIHFHLIIGKKDLVIPKKFSNKLMAGIEDKNVLHILPVGHYMFKEEVGVFIRKLVGQ